MRSGSRQPRVSTMSMKRCGCCAGRACRATRRSRRRGDRSLILDVRRHELVSHPGLEFVLPLGSWARGRASLDSDAEVALMPRGQWVTWSWIFQVGSRMPWELWSLVLLDRGRCSWLRSRVAVFPFARGRERWRATAPKWPSSTPMALSRSSVRRASTRAASTSWRSPRVTDPPLMARQLAVLSSARGAPERGGQHHRNCSRPPPASARNRGYSPVMTAKQ
jgi:hypothetical protein